MWFWFDCVRGNCTYWQINKAGGDVECAGNADSTAAAARNGGTRNETEAELVAAIAASVLFLASRPSACKHPIELVTVHWRRRVTEPAEECRTGR